MKKQNNNAVHDKIDLQALKESEARFRSIVLWSPDAIIVTDAKGKILYMNPAAEKVFNHKVESFIGKDFGLPLVNGETTEIDIFRPGKDPGVGDMYVVETEWLGEKAHLITIRDITGRKRAESQREAALESLRESEEKYRLVVENANEAIIIIQDMKIVFVNCATVNLIGYSKEILTSKLFKDIIHPDDCNIVLAHNIGKIESREVIPVYFFRVISQNGAVKWVELNTTVIHWKERPATLVFLNDTTERKLAEKALQKSEENFRLSLNDSPLGVCIVTAEGEILYANQSILKIYGYESIEELRGTPLQERYTPESYTAFRIRKDERGEGEFGQSEYEISIVRKNGEVRNVQVFRKEIWWNGAKNFQIIYEDITERNRGEEMIREAEERYRTLFEDAQDGIALADAANNQLVDCNRALCRMVERDKQELVGQAQNILHPPEYLIDGMSPTFQKHQRGNPGQALEDQLMARGGRLIPVEIRTAKTRINNHDFLLGIFRDITERKRAENELKQSENKYRLLADNIHDVVFALDMNLKYTYVSPSVKIMRGYEPDEVLKMSPAETLTPSSMDLAMKTLSEVMELEKIKPVDITESRTIPLEMRRKDGTTVWTEVKLSFIRDKNQQAVGLLGVTRDNTERKLADEKLQETLENLRKSFNTTIQVMVSAVEMKDPYTAGHQLRAADIARSIATEMRLAQGKIDGIHMAGSIHDIGKLSIPAEILSKPTKLTNIEFSMIKEHSRSGYDILKNVESPWPLAQIVYQHHERMDGSGYPRKLKGDEIIMEARIMAVADVVEAMASHRPYRPALGIDAALEEIEKNKGILYDDAVADACLKLFREKGYKLIA